MPAESWWKLITPKEMRAGMNQLNGRKILILDFVSSVMVHLNSLIMRYIFLYREYDWFGYLYKKAIQRIFLCLLFLLKIIKLCF